MWGGGISREGASRLDGPRRSTSAYFILSTSKEKRQRQPRQILSSENEDEQNAAMLFNSAAEIVLPPHVPLNNHIRFLYVTISEFENYSLLLFRPKFRWCICPLRNDTRLKTMRATYQHHLFIIQICFLFTYNLINVV